jgi:hypothetical protein
VPGYDRTVPPGLSPFLRALNLPIISYLRAIQPLGFTLGNHPFKRFALKGKEMIAR